MESIEEFLGIKTEDDIPIPDELKEELALYKMLQNEKSRNLAKQYVSQSGLNLSSIISEDTCLYCNNRGYDTFGATECSKCHRKRVTLMDIPYWEYSNVGFQIPPNYRKRWDVRTIFKTIESTRSIISDIKLRARYNEVANLMMELIDGFENDLSRNPTYMYVTMDKVLDTIQWIYNLMQLYGLQKFSVTEILPITKVYMEGDVCNVCDSEVMFLNLTPYDRKYSALKLDSIVSIRQLHGLTTIILAPTDWESFSLNTNEKLSIEPDKKITVY